MRIQPVKGANDYLPQEAALRDYLQSSILETYRKNGFVRIMTPAIEDIENLDKSEGGDNLNLIFKIMKRGRKLTDALEAGNEKELADLGLRYDLTLPLSRFYANNRQNLMLPFKCIQIDKAYRAERPQKGRLREFMQCDIDILGSDSKDCEVELISVTAEALCSIGLDNFKIKINDRRILNSMLLALGFEKGELQGACIILDKLDKIGLEGVEQELYDRGFSGSRVQRLMEILNELPVSMKRLQEICPEQEAVQEVQEIIRQVRILSENQYAVEFDISLVRGQGYYTGTVFEIESMEYNRSIAGGGRYDNLIGKFTGEHIPAVGFSIGFEAIYYLLSEKRSRVPDARKRVAMIYESDVAAARQKAKVYQAEYDVALYRQPKKLGKFLNGLRQQSFDGCFICGRSEEIEWF